MAVKVRRVGGRSGKLAGDLRAVPGRQATEAGSEQQSTALPL